MPIYIYIAYSLYIGKGSYAPSSLSLSLSANYLEHHGPFHTKMRSRILRAPPHDVVQIRIWLSSKDRSTRLSSPINRATEVVMARQRAVI